MAVLLASSANPGRVISLAILVLAIVVPVLVHGHSRSLSLTSRWGGYCGAHNTKNVCPPCGYRDKRFARPSQTVYQRGQSIPFVYPRNNHAGGFLMFAVRPFNSPQGFYDFFGNVIQYSCFESNCRSGTSNPLGPDPPGTPEDGNRCSTRVTIPTWLPDGQYTLHWHLFGTGSYYGDLMRGIGDYYGCHDFTIRGGSRFRVSSKPTCPLFIDGDAHTPSGRGQCLHHGTAAPLRCFPEGCRGSYRRGPPDALARCWNNGGQSAGRSVARPTMIPINERPRSLTTREPTMVPMAMHPPQEQATTDA
ncbi:hypothetical protein BCR44DRAFT_62607 [Catenaria anguillulae PL171]|uniref:Uncharacterized protein n=1 Tax=Catenaria anguillulae PL171 TaxID=765915 RepID=A0A1Y2HDY3_9FUNG|nr:hypothetical protein BCR44DRAFT_62607 [Catenaria anguillulae PL171]